ncbi:SRPBCC family protein [Skermania sp. ID1734]|uniref:type II toxin-antitoxin system Rv0910 family toxin n=1 Tax=Skermania sp. ID1734 TaxID=2597516 RepID=UPI00117E8F79|nr:SRPBCC family protein [Skermania sp. ID1734]TSD99804.1 SRPBCC family protein [Skermania sp. ID1734]
MASVTVSVSLPSEPQKTWDTLADAARWEEWLSIHQKWKSEIPTEIKVGTQFTEVVSVMGMANKIEWTIDELDIPHRMKMSGTGMAGVVVELALAVEPENDGSKASIEASFTGAMIVGPIGKAVAKNAQADLESSLAKFAELVA